MAFPPWWAKSEMSGNLVLFFFSFLLFFLRGSSGSGAEISSNAIRSELPASVEKSGAQAF